MIDDFPGNMKAKSETINDVCDAIAGDRLAEAKSLIKKEYPFLPSINAGRKYTEHQKTKVFVRDGFIDRYSGEKLVFPPVLRILSTVMPEEFPFHKNWKMSECHLAYWQLMPTIDHIVPVARGGIDEEDNWVCCSQLRNSAKSNWLLEELGWEFQDLGNLAEWDGLINWFIDYTEEKPEVLSDYYINTWHKAAMRVLGNKLD